MLETSTFEDLLLDRFDRRDDDRAIRRREARVEHDRTVVAEPMPKRPRLVQSLIVGLLIG